jgi:beta-lactamase class A
MRFAACLAVIALWSPSVSNAQSLDAAQLEKAVRAKEARLSAQIGVAVLDTKSNALWSYRGDERFPLLSTHKAFACAALLAKVGRGETSLQKQVTLLTTDLVANSPITKKHIGPDSMSLAELCAAAIAVSDNTAANAVLSAIGGPAALTDYFRSLGDQVSRLDRNETDLNENAPGDPRDTTTPAAAVADLNKLLLGDAMKPDAREQLKQWMLNDAVSGPLLRAAAPSDWRIADKTGAGERGSRGIIAVLWPPDRAPIVTAIYIRQTTASLDERNAAIARIGGALVTALPH